MHSPELVPINLLSLSLFLFVFVNITSMTTLPQIQIRVAPKTNTTRHLEKALVY